MRRQIPLIISSTATFLLLAYSTIVTVAMPVIADDLHTGFGALQWVIDIYTIALAALLVPLGTISDRLGRRPVLIWSLVAFAAASLACALAPNVLALVLARFVQGIAAAALFATTLPLLEAAYSGRAKHRAFAVWGAVSGLAAAAGNVSGGLLSTLGWRTVFAAAVPIALAAAVLTAVFIPADRAREPGPLNVPGMVLLAAAVGGFVIATLVFADQGLSPTAALMLAVSTALCAGFIAHERSHPATALIGPALVRNRVFVVAAVVAVAYYFAAFGALPSISSWLQDALGLTPVETALVLSAQPVVFFLTSALLGALVGRLHRRIPFAVGLVVCGLGCLGLALPAAAPGWQAIMPAMVLTGIGAGIISPVLPAAAMHGVAPSRTGISSSAVNAARQLGISLGIAACATAVRIHRPGHDHALWSHTLLAVALVTTTVCAGATGIVLVVLGRRRSPSTCA
ncbi:MFS transporter [Streptomyces sp. ITFR-16]|uniref:MFS transporter n=1 Tax=Streptomyces sp. ITFR-16 TaxID=3075198 RepID=UPI002889993A|nr:MFS transporter [Streptomyces sp. ITFR-16]WNI22263.1 MFS transporter [Streptomyces sp. ITFR-16]